MTTTSTIPRDLTSSALARAIREWRHAIGESRVVTDTDRYNTDTSSFSGRIPAAVRPTCTEQVQHVVRIAQRYSIPLYPISTGHNWGYGTSVPPRSPAVILDLASLRRILDFDEELGVVTLEPGVTQGDLSEYLTSRNLPYLVPVTGAGPSCSVVANALERGFGVTPLTDHFGAVISMKVVLPDGELYESYTRGFNAAGAASAFRWGVGPYLDGLFSQSNLGIVVDASIALQPRTERTGALLFEVESHQHVEALTTNIRRLLAEAGQTIGAINVMSRSRLECMSIGFRQLRGAARAETAQTHTGLTSCAWFGFGSVYGSTEHYRATCRLARRYLREHARRIRVYTSDDVTRLRRLSAWAAAVGWSALTGQVDRLEAAVGVVQGAPTRFALPLAYARSGRPCDSGELNPARDGCGLTWYSPIVPMRRGVVGQFIAFAEGTCSRHGLPAPITLTTLSPRCYASTIPLLFDRAAPEAEHRARMCFEELYEKGLALGFVPYRIGSQFMPALARHGAAVAPLLGAVKRVLDPNLVLAPGRYSFTET